MAALDLGEIKTFWEVLLLIGGSFVTGYHVVRKRHNYQAEISVSATLKSVTHEYLDISTEAKNTGTKRINIDRDASYLRIYELDETPANENPQSPQWKFIGIFDAFKEHDWIEPGETIKESLRFVLPGSDCVSFRVDLRLVSRQKQRKVGWQWAARAFADKENNKTG